MRHLVLNTPLKTKMISTITTRTRNSLNTFTYFKREHLNMQEEDDEDYKSKFLILYDKVTFGQDRKKVSVSEDIDFEVELIQKDEINIT